MSNKEFAYTFSVPMSLENLLKDIATGDVSDWTSKRLKILKELNKLTTESGLISVEFFKSNIEGSTDITVSFSSVRQKLWFETQMETLAEE